MIMESPIRKIAIDPGFGGFKVAEVRGEQVAVELIPSVVGVGGHTDTGLLQVWSTARHKQVKPLTISFNGSDLSYLVGPNVHRFTRPTERLDFKRLSGGAELRALLYAALGKIIGSGTHQTALMIGLPVEIIQDEALVGETMRGLQSWVIGEHTFSVDEQPINLTISQLKVMAQPVGSYFAWGLDARGKWIRPIEALKQPVGVCDIGFNTVDLFAVEKGEVVNRFVGGNTLGMHRANEMTARHIRTKYGVDLSLHQADELMRVYLNRQLPLFYYAEGEVDLSQPIHQALDDTFATLNQFIRSHWDRARQFRHLIITGGGAQALKTWLLPHYPQAIILSNSVTANADGMARYSVRPGLLG